MTPALAVFLVLFKLCHGLPADTAFPSDEIHSHNIDTLKTQFNIHHNNVVNIGTLYKTEDGDRETTTGNTTLEITTAAPITEEDTTAEELETTTVSAETIDKVGESGEGLNKDEEEKEEEEIEKEEIIDEGVGENGDEKLKKEDIKLPNKKQTRKGD